MEDPQVLGLELSPPCEQSRAPLLKNLHSLVGLIWRHTYRGFRGHSLAVSQGANLDKACAEQLSSLPSGFCILNLLLVMLMLAGRHLLESDE